MFDLLRDKRLRSIVLANLFTSFGRGMILIGISWYIVESTGRAGPLGITMLISTALMVLVGPNLGIIIDRFSRKKILMIENFLGALLLGIFSLVSIYATEISLILLTVIYIISMLLSQIHFPTQSAFVQEIFNSTEYQKVNSTLEVQIQIAQVLAGAFAGIILTYYSLTLVLTITSFTYLIAFFLLSPIKYQFSIERKNLKKKKWTQDLTTGLTYVFTIKGILVFGISVFIPLIILMVSNLLAPVYINIDLDESVSIFTFGELTYAIGAFLAGMLSVLIIGKFSKLKFMITTLGLFSLALVVMVISSNSWVFIATYLYLGWTVASTRIISQTIFMEVIPKELMGRVLTAIDMLALIIRVALIGSFTFLLDSLGAGFAYLILGLLACLGSIGISVSYRAIYKRTKINFKEINNPSVK